MVAVFENGIRCRYFEKQVCDAIPDICDDQIRVDNRWQVSGHVEWMIHKLVGFRMSAAHWRRSSNCEASDYKANILSAGIALGWK